MKPVAPKSIHIEITTRCSAHCAMCPRDSLERRDMDMCVGDILGLARQSRSMGATEIHPHLFGESTMHPEYIAVLAMLKHDIPDMEIVQYTNGFGLLDGGVREAVLGAVARLTISVDGATPEEMLATRPGLDPERIAAGIEALYAKRQGRHPHITMRCTVREPSGGKMAAYLKRWGPHCDRMIFPLLQGFHGFLPDVEPRRDGGACDRIFNCLVVDVMGRAVLCCDDYAGEVVLGDTVTTPLADIWNGEKLARIRSLHLSGKYDQVPICAKCSWHGNFKAKQ